MVQEGLHFLGSRGSSTRDFLGIDQGGSRTSHQFRALAKAHKESRDERRERALD